MKSTTRTPVTAPLLDFRMMVLAVAATLALAVNASEARQRGAQRQVTGGQHAPVTSSVQRSRGADGAVDATRTGPHGGTTTVDRYRDGADATDARITGPKGGVSTVDRTRGSDGLVDSTVTRADGRVVTTDRIRGTDGLVDKTVTGANGKTVTTDRARGSDGLVDKTVTGPKGQTASVDRSRGADGVIDKTVTGPKGTTTYDRSRGADGVIDTVRVRRTGRGDDGRSVAWHRWTHGQDDHRSEGRHDSSTALAAPMAQSTRWRSVRTAARRSSTAAATVTVRSIAWSRRRLQPAVNLSCVRWRGRRSASAPYRL